VRNVHRGGVSATSNIPIMMPQTVQGRKRTIFEEQSTRPQLGRTIRTYIRENDYWSWKKKNAVKTTRNKMEHGEVKSTKGEKTIRAHGGGRFLASTQGAKKLEISADPSIGEAKER